MRTSLSYSPPPHPRKPHNPPSFAQEDMTPRFLLGGTSGGWPILATFFAARVGIIDSRDFDSLDSMLPHFSPLLREVEFPKPSEPHPTPATPPQSSRTPAPPHPRATSSPQTETAPATTPNISPPQSLHPEKSPPDETPVIPRCPT